MDELFETIEKMPKGQQLNILLELLQEKGAALLSLRNESFIRNRRSGKTLLANSIKTEWLQCEIIKAKIKQLYNENIPDELPVQNIAQP